MKPNLLRPPFSGNDGYADMMESVEGVKKPVFSCLFYESKSIYVLPTEFFSPTGGCFLT
jgi:hypothetical protein